MARFLMRPRTFLQSIRQVNIPGFATFTQRDFQYEDHSHSGTLLNRFSRAIAEEVSRDAKIVRNSIKYSQFYPVHKQEKFQKDIQKVDSDQLSRLIMFTANYRGNADIGKIFRVINDLDCEANDRIRSLEYRDVQELMYMFLYLLPNKITQLDFVRSGIEILLDGFPQNKTKGNFLQICFYLGIFKKSRLHCEQLKDFLKTHLNDYLSDLDSMQLALVANSAFKASITIPNEDFHERLKAAILSMDQDVDIQLLVTFAKSLRHNRVDCMSTGILDKIQQLLQSGKIPDVDLRGYTHLLALFVENRHVPPSFGKYVYEEGMNIIREEHEKSVIRSKDEMYTNPNFRQKDLATFLWCITNLPDKTVTKDDATTLTNAILWKLRNYEYKYAYDEFVDTLLSLVMLGIKSDALFKAFFNDRNFLIPPKNQNRTKLHSKQLLLTTCLQIVAPELVPKDREKRRRKPIEVPDYLLQKRKHFLNVGQTLKDLQEEFNIVKMELKIPVQNINIPSYMIEIETQERQNHVFWIELLDAASTMSDLVTPTPIVRLKLRLLQALDEDFIVVDTINKESEELKEVLRRAIKEHVSSVNSDAEAEVQKVVTT
uniref:Uncharacterized protein n=1 Tax=Lutzomyia longipalpis TaxID=7200 RepID=A0A7G3AKH7_LUTLO